VLGWRSARWAVGAAFLLLSAARPAAAEFVAPLQVDLSIPVASAEGARARRLVPIENGPARLRAVVRTLPGGETARIDLTLEYRLPPGTIGLDELVEGIEITTASANGDPFQSVVLDTQLIPLNPNRARLFYRATLYQPNDGKSYLVRIRLHGNYE
jgi:hypothetical protein